MRNNYLYLIILILAFSQCTQPTSDYVAEAYGKFLTKEDIPNFRLSGEDSAQAVNTYINNWLREEVVINQADLNLPDSIKDVSKQLEQYRKSLITYAYEQSLIRQKLDTLITQTEIKAYYDSNAQNFELKDYLIKVIYAKIPNESMEGVELEFWKRSNLVSHEDSIRKELSQFTNELIDGTEWLQLNKILVQLPLRITDEEKFIKTTKFKRFTFENDVYFVHVLDQKMKDSVSPLSMVESKIKAIILNKRKKELLDKMKNDLYNNALKQKKIQIKLPNKKKINRSNDNKRK